MKPWLDLDAMMQADPVKGAFLTGVVSPGTPSLFRMALWRVWDSALPMLGIVGLNPSRADAREDDHTVRRWLHFARFNGYGGFIVTNLYAYRATDPLDLVSFGLASAVGPNNDDWIKAVCAGRDVLVCWGANPGGRTDAVYELISPIATRVLCLGRTKDGHPMHPARLTNDIRFAPWAPERRS